MYVAGDELATGAREPIGHGDHDGFLQTEHIGQLRVVRQRMHDRQLGRAGITKKVRNALVDEQLQEGRPAGGKL